MFKDIKNESNDESDANEKWMNFVTIIYHTANKCFEQKMLIGWFSLIFLHAGSYQNILLFKLLQNTNEIINSLIYKMIFFFENF